MLRQISRPVEPERLLGAGFRSGRGPRLDHLGGSGICVLYLRLGPSDEDADRDDRAFGEQADPVEERSALV